MFDRRMLLAACFTAYAALPAAACEQHEKSERLPPSAGRIYFQPDEPAKAQEGEVWINARSGRQLVLMNGEWILREIAAGLAKAAS